MLGLTCPWADLYGIISFIVSRAYSLYSPLLFSLSLTFSLSAAGHTGDVGPPLYDAACSVIAYKNQSKRSRGGPGWSSRRGTAAGVASSADRRTQCRSRPRRCC